MEHLFCVVCCEQVQLPGGRWTGVQIKLKPKKVWLLAFENRVNRAPVSPSPEG